MKEVRGGRMFMGEFHGVELMEGQITTEENEKGSENLLDEHEGPLDGYEGLR
jgi:hypothetical protein